MNGHHLILGECTDYITGKSIDDTHDERYRQKLARLLVETRGYMKKEIMPRYELEVRAGDKRARLAIDFVIQLEGKTAMIIKYGPGSLLTRHRPALAMSRLVESCLIPVVVVTNGENADILDGKSGKVLKTGIDAIPTGHDLALVVKKASYEPLSALRLAMESRIVYAYEVDGSCPCDDNICRL